MSRLDELQPKSPFELMGGHDAIHRIVEKFYERMDTLPEAAGIRSMHAEDLTHTKDILKKYLAEWTGGPNQYSQERGHPRLRMRHSPFKIGIAERDAWLRCMAGALEEVVTQEGLRLSMLQKLAQLADMMRNDAGAPVGGLSVQGIRKPPQA